MPRKTIQKNLAYDTERQLYYAVFRHITCLKGRSWSSKLVVKSFNNFAIDFILNG